MNRQYDNHVAFVVGKFLDRYLYHHVTRVYDKERQIKGIDLITDKGTKVDEKVKYKNCLNRELKKIGFEISRICRDGQRHDGWLIDGEQETQVYNIINIWTTDYDEYDIEFDKIYKTVSLVIQKKRLMNYLESLRLTVENIKSIQQKMLEKKITKLNIIENQVYFTMSNQYKECPINLVIKRQILLDQVNAKEFITERNY